MQPTKLWPAPGPPRSLRRPGQVNFRQCYGCGAETWGDVLCADCRQDPAYGEAAFFCAAPPYESLGVEDLRQADMCPGDAPGRRMRRALIAGAIVGGLILGAGLGAGLVWALRLAAAAAHAWRAIFGG